MKFNIQQEDGILKYATEAEVKTALEIPKESNVDVVRTESRGSALYKFNLKELTDVETSSEVRLGFYNKESSIEPMGSPMLVIKNHKINPSQNYIEFRLGTEETGTNSIALETKRTILRKQGFYSNTSEFVLSDNSIPSWKAVTDYVDAKPSGATSLQEVTEGVGNNTTTNSLHINGIGSRTPTVSGMILTGGSGSVERGQISAFNYNLNEVGRLMFGDTFTSLVRYGQGGSNVTLNLFDETETLAGAIFSSRVSGQPASRSNEFVTYSQVSQMIADAIANL